MRTKTSQAEQQQQLNPLLDHAAGAAGNKWYCPKILIYVSGLQNEHEVESAKRWDGSGSNLRPLPASEVLEKCLNQQGIPKNVILGTKNIKIGPLGPKLAHTQCTVGLAEKWL